MERTNSSLVIILALVLIIVVLHTCKTVSGNGLLDFDPFGGSPGFDADDHIRGKRMAAGSVASDMQFVLTRTNGSNTPQIGDVLSYRIDIWLPKVNSSGLALMVEISSANPENRNVCLALCKPTVSSVGNKITSLENRNLSLTEPTMYYNPNLPQVNDKAILNFGRVANSDDLTTTNPNSSSLVSITFCAALIDTGIDSSPVYITTGGEYADSSYIWVGQDQLTPSYANRNSLGVATFSPKEGNLNNNVVLTPGSSMSKLLVATVLTPWTSFAFGANTADYHEFISFGVVAVTFPRTGYYRHNNFDRAVTYTGRTNYEGAYILRETKFQRLINMRGLGGNSLSDPGNEIQVAFSICVSPNAPQIKPTNPFTIVAYAKVGSILYTSNITGVSVALGPPEPRTPGTNMATFIVDQAVSTLSPTNVIPPGGAVIYLVKTVVPASGWFNYSLKVTPSAGFTACSARMEFFGGAIGCAPPLDNKTVTVDNNTGVLVINFVAKRESLTTADDIQNQVWVAVTVSGGSVNGSVQFTDTAGTSKLMDIVVDAKSLAQTIPSGVISSSFENQNWYVGGQIAYDVAISLPVNYPTDSFSAFEAMGDATGLPGFQVRMCRATLKLAGRGVGCLSTDLQKESLYRKSVSTNVYNDKVTMPLGSVCASDLIVDNTFDQQFIMSVVADLPYQTNITTVMNYTMTAGVSISQSLIWVGNIQFKVQLPTTAPPTYTASTLPILNGYSVDPSPFIAGGFGRARFVVNIPPGVTSKFQLLVNSSSIGFSICALTLKGIGSNFPCVDPDPSGKWGPDQGTRLTYVRRNSTNPFLGNSAALLEFGPLTNVGSDPFLPKSRGDANTIVVEVLVGTTSKSAGITNDLTGKLMWTGGSTTNNVTGTALNPTVNGSNADFNLTFVDRDPKVTADYQFVPGVAKKIDIDIQPVNVTGDITGAFFEVMLENTDPSAWPYNICCASLAYAGRNFPCINHTGNGFRTNTTKTSRGTIVSTMIFTIGDVCYTPLFAPDNNNTRLTIEAFLIVGSFNETVASVDFRATLYVNAVKSSVRTVVATLTSTSGSAISAGTAGGTVSLLTSPNVTNISASAGAPIPLVSRARGVVAFNVCVPPNELVPFEANALAAGSDTRARATVLKITSQRTGPNIACMSDLSAYKTDFLSSPSLTSSTQKDQAIVRAYYLRNTGFTYKSDSWQAGDDCMTLWAEIEVTDHPSNFHNSNMSIAVGAKIGASTSVQLQTVTVQRPNTSEYADLFLNMTVVGGSNTTIYNLNQLVPLSLVACHSSISTREAVDPMIRVIYPPYMDYSDSQVISHNSSYTLTAVKQGPYVVFKLPYILFTECIQVNFTLTVNPNVTETPQPSSVAGGVDATTLARVVCKMQQFASPSTLNPANATAYYHCGESAAVTYMVNAVGCRAVSLGMESKRIQDCQITASTSATIATPPQNARPGVSGYWSPALGSFEPYLEIHFGNVTEISSIDFSTDPNGAAVTGYRIMTSFDGFAFSDVENGTTSPYVPSNGLVKGRFLRFVITKTNPDTKLVGLKLEPKGCYRSSDLTVTETCSYVPPTRFTDDIKSWRHVVVDTENKIAYFCVYHTTKLRTFCYSGTAEGTTWQTCPGYVSYFAGVDTAATPDRVIGVDGEDAAYVYSEDGISWVPLTAADYTAATSLSSFVKSTPVPSHTSSDAPLAVTGAPGWTADNTGISFNGARKVIWSTCCN